MKNRIFVITGLAAVLMLSSCNGGGSSGGGSGSGQSVTATVVDVAQIDTPTTSNKVSKISTTIHTHKIIVKFNHAVSDIRVTLFEEPSQKQITSTITQKSSTMCEIISHDLQPNHKYKIQIFASYGAFGIFRTLFIGSGSGGWAWNNGSNLVGNAGSTTYPSSRRSSGAWQTMSNNYFYVFGGVMANNTDRQNDLWRYDPANNSWLYLGPSTDPLTNPVNQSSDYLGSKGSGPMPGARSSVANWVDNKGNLWMFGGNGYDGNGNLGENNDMWAYNASQSQTIQTTDTKWTFFGGGQSVNQPGVYGTQGVASASNIPGAREAAATWVDADNNLWLFGGGSGFDSNSPEFLNDVWKYTPDINNASGKWTWMGGSNTANSAGTYGAASGNIPSARLGAYIWSVNANNQNLVYLYGGENLDGVLGDLWVYNINTNTWTCLSGNTENANIAAVYGTKGFYSATSTPGARASGTSWTDTDGNLWLFGGANAGTGYFNDLWKYNVVLGQWSYRDGSTLTNASGIYPSSFGASHSFEYSPGARGNTISWNYNGTLGLFGGYGYDSVGNVGMLNDMWNFLPPTTTPKEGAIFGTTYTASGTSGSTSTLIHRP